MTKENVNPETDPQIENEPIKPKRKGISRFFYISKADYYISTVAALFFAFVAWREITDPEETFLNIEHNYFDKDAKFRLKKLIRG